LGGVIAEFNDASKKIFLESVQSNPDVYNKIRPDIFLFEDIEKLDNGDVKKLISALNIEVLAASIAKDDGKASGKLMSNLTGAGQAMVNQFIDLKKDSLSDLDVSSAQNKVVQQMKVLSNQGTIDLVSKLVS
jgi:flagellar motor switch protein FliG